MEPGVPALCVEEQWRMERREVWSDGQVVFLEEITPILADLEVAGDKEDDDVGVNQEGEQPEEGGERPSPPVVAACGCSEPFSPGSRQGYLCHEASPGYGVRLGGLQFFVAR
jgi:hypothetical protein